MNNLSLTHSKSKVHSLLIGGMLVFLLVLGLFSLSKGAFTISFAQVVSILFPLDWAPYEAQQVNVLYSIRLPRILMATLIGGGLGIAGASLQGLFRNPLVEPGLIGVSSGSALFAVIFLVLIPTLTQAFGLISTVGLPFFAFLGGLVHVLAVYYLGGRGKSDTATLILAGVAINALAGALIGLTLFYADDAALRSFTFWSLGDLGGSTWAKVPLAALLILLPSLILFGESKNLNALSLGEQEAFHMGVNVKQTKIKLLTLTALIVGVGVAFTGMIGFVGLIVPHLIRIGFGADHRLVLPASFLLGAILLNVADLIGRTWVAPAELPIGVITALLGAPFFIALIFQLHKSKN
ncbi:FecCD family ABC transporter permease [Algoriphagus taiwanensis]|uniref:Iron ABC transporter permease n=1 Tax=Algoriphagus taiwanensis TaxID=1445656 RepID=A0ABQ6Q1G5_9BACT|nr:iron ABC transporter permease [Algoriphagus taiwanensis]